MWYIFIEINTSQVFVWKLNIFERTPPTTGGDARCSTKVNWSCSPCANRRETHISTKTKYLQTSPTKPSFVSCIPGLCRYFGIAWLGVWRFQNSGLFLLYLCLLSYKTLIHYVRDDPRRIHMCMQIGQPFILEVKHGCLKKFVTSLKLDMSKCQRLTVSNKAWI